MTSILRDSLGGNCKTVFMNALSAQFENVEESISTCRFAGRCSKLTVDVEINEELDAESMVVRLEAEVHKLKRKLRNQRKLHAEQLEKAKGCVCVCVCVCGTTTVCFSSVHSDLP
jgi:hypothetical protein